LKQIRKSASCILSSSRNPSSNRRSESGGQNSEDFKVD